MTELDWNFDGVPDHELVACCFWEYARESAFIRDVKRRCVDARWWTMAPCDAWAFLGKDLERIRSVGYPARPDPAYLCLFARFDPGGGEGSRKVQQRAGFNAS